MLPSGIHGIAIGRKSNLEAKDDKMVPSRRGRDEMKLRWDVELRGERGWGRQKSNRHFVASGDRTKKCRGLRLEWGWRHKGTWQWPPHQKRRWKKRSGGEMCRVLTTTSICQYDGRTTGDRGTVFQGFQVFTVRLNILYVSVLSNMWHFKSQKQPMKNCQCFNKLTFSKVTYARKSIESKQIDAKKKKEDKAREKQTFHNQRSNIKGTVSRKHTYIDQYLNMNLPPLTPWKISYDYPPT